ncbi:Lipopolysaccharide biosynthesis protein, LPS:glycosyltransferase [Marinococcus luteus]|uniref:Lipopolysaccharide biosynthesis protein, LPS:glycosyltransferase n=2 Tax=Marinococcus luteus TaxID=1122204 RepID=A0A1H2RK57_9BACI|nr:Lipopolysaccharide biosynthesis protein, LPS:glycosyltransferase [Marinococcus luteus]
MKANYTYMIASIADHHYADSLGVAMMSLLSNTSQPDRLVFCIVDGGLSLKDKYCLEQLAQRFHATIRLIPDEWDFYSGQTWADLEHYPHVSRFASYRLLLPYLIEEKVDRLLYLDSDTMIRTDITALWDEPMGTRAVAVAEPGPDTERAAALGLPRVHGSLDPGLMMINVPQWKAQHLSTSVFTHMTTLGHTFADSLHSVTYSDQWWWHPRWNTTTDMFTQPLPSHAYGNRVVEALQTPSAVHFNGPVKPWHAYCPHPYKYEYTYYRHQLLSLVTLTPPVWTSPPLQESDRSL